MIWIIDKEQKKQINKIPSAAYNSTDFVGININSNNILNNKP